MTDKLRSLGLTEREIEVACLMKTGIENSEIAKALNISHKTVKCYNTSMFLKLRVKNRCQAIVCLFNLEKC